MKNLVGGAIFRRLVVFAAMTAVSFIASSNDGSASGGLQPVEDIVNARHFRMHSAILDEDRDLLLLAIYADYKKQ